MLILSPEDRAALWHQTIASDRDGREGMLRVLAKEMQEILSGELPLYDFDDELESSVRLLDESGFLARDDLRQGFEQIGEDEESGARFVLTMAGYLEQTGDVSRLSAKHRVQALKLAIWWRDAIYDQDSLGQDTTMSVAEVASHFGVTPQAVYKWCDAGKIKYERTPGGSYRIPTDQFDLDWGASTRPAREALKKRLVEKYGDRQPMSDAEIAEALETSRRADSGR
jgi:excisionase family DNA binding protein